MTPATPFHVLREAADLFADLRAEGYALPNTGTPSLVQEIARRLGLSHRGAHHRLDTAHALGLPLPGWQGVEPERAAHIRLRYRTFDDAYKAWSRQQAREGKAETPPTPDAARPPEGFEIHSRSATYDAEGELKQQSIRLRQAPGEVFEPPAGHAVKGVSALVDAEGRVVQRWVKTREGAIGEGLVEAMKEAFAAFAGAAPLTPPPTATLGHLHTVYPLADLHLGMYAWSQEVGSSYDLEIATERARNAYRALIPQAPASRSCTLLILGDYFHANDQTAATPRSGHRLDVDGRWQKVFRAGADLLLELGDLLAQHHERVEIVVLEGNHDPDAAVALREALRLFYAKAESRISVYGGAALFWYFRFGRCLLGATHGHTVKMGKLAGVMAHDCPEDWGETFFRAWFTGHIHHERSVEEGGVRIESLNTLAGRDAYGHSGGWRAGHAVQAITFHEHAGEVSRARVNVLTERPRLRAGARTA